MPRDHTKNPSRPKIILPSVEPSPFDPEEWRSVMQWPGYDVSDWGRFRTYWIGGGPGSGRGARKIGAIPKIVGGNPTHDGHRTVSLTRPSTRERLVIGVHILVLETFVGPCPDGMQACHWDGNSANNRLGNLRWGTLSDNTQDRLRHGTHNWVKLQIDDIPEIWRRLVAGHTATAIARDHKVSRTTITLIKLGRNWSHVTKNLPGRPVIRPFKFIGPPSRLAEHHRKAR
jgi:hypothetical protein